MPSIDATTDFAHQLGCQLRQAREAAGMNVEAVSARLKLHVGVVQALEAGDWQRLGAPVFVRGQLRSYGKLVGVNLASADEHLARLQRSITARPAAATVQVPLLPQEPGSRLRPLLLYGLGGVLLAAAAWVLVQRYQSAGDPVATSPGHPRAIEPETDTAPPMPLAALRADPPPQANLPLDAGAGAPQPEPAAAATQTVAGAAQATLILRARSDSWLELYTPAGQVLEHTLLRAGEQRRFARGQVGRVLIGNADGVDVLADGAAQDLAPFRRANVARFAVSSDGALAPLN